MKLAASAVLLVGALAGEEPTFKILATGSFGEPLNSCRVESFRSIPGPNVESRDYADHFVSLTGRGVPAGNYDAFVRCKEGRLYSAVAVRSTSAIAVISRNERAILGERGMQTLVVRMESPPAADAHWWARLVGLYNQENYVAEFSPATGVATFDAPDPGTYLVTVLSTGGYECVAEVDLFEGTRQWGLRRSNCTFTFDRYAHLVSAADSADHRNGAWFKRMQRDREKLFDELDAASRKK